MYLELQAVLNGMFGDFQAFPKLKMKGSSNWDFQLRIFCRPSIDPRLSQAPSGGPTNLTVVTVGNGVNLIFRP